MEFGAAQSEQRRMPGRDAVLPYVSDQQLVRPQFVGVSQLLRLLAGTVLYPGNRVVRQLPRLARSGQLSQCRVQTELKQLLTQSTTVLRLTWWCCAMASSLWPDSESKRKAARRARRFSSVRDLRMDSSLSTSCSLNWTRLRFLGKGMPH